MSNKSGTSSQIISLLKGGGALQGIGETFAPALFHGTGNFTVPIALPPGRNGSQPELPQEKLQRKFIENKFQEALEALPPDQKTIFILRVFENQSYKGISELLNIPHGTVMSRLAYARGKLKQELSRQLEVV